jgi:hypothetical protein
MIYNNIDFLKVRLILPLAFAFSSALFILFKKSESEELAINFNCFQVVALPLNSLLTRLRQLLFAEDGKITRVEYINRAEMTFKKLSL